MTNTSNCRGLNHSMTIKFIHPMLVRGRKWRGRVFNLIHLQRWAGLMITTASLTHSGLVTPYGDKGLGQHWLYYSWRHQAITWTNVDWSSVKSRIRAISQEMPQPSITELYLKITYIKFHSNLPGINELIHPSCILYHHPPPPPLTFLHGNYIGLAETT